jgi:malate synthase
MSVQVIGPYEPRFDEALTPEALEFLHRLDGAFAGRRAELLRLRKERGELRFLPETKAIREDPDWRVASPAPGLVDRRVEITGPTSAKMTVNALNSGARVWLADFEDANTPSWHNMIDGQLNLIDAVRRRLDFTSGGKQYRIGENPATIVVRPRGWHLSEKHLRIDGRPIPASLVDFGLYFFHNARELLENGSGPYFYLAKQESHLEARLWNDVFCLAQDLLGIPRGTIRATVLIETIPAAFEMEEILYELREHSAGLNAGRWDYIFSIIKNVPHKVLPDRGAVTMTAPFMRAYTDLLVATCHRRGAHAIGGMAAVIPSRRDPAANERAFAKVRQDKDREAGDGFDGSWVAHPDLVAVCRRAFDEVLGKRPNQLDRQRLVSITAADLLNIEVPGAAVTEDGLRTNVGVALRYLQAWLGGNGAAGINNLMEDAATAEISRAQVWQWIHNGITLPNGKRITRDLVESIADEEMAAIEPKDNLRQAWQIFADNALGEELSPFFTTTAYCRYLVTPDTARAGAVGR